MRENNEYAIKELLAKTNVDLEYVKSNVSDSVEDLEDAYQAIALEEAAEEEAVNSVVDAVVKTAAELWVQVPMPELESSDHWSQRKK